MPETPFKDRFLETQHLARELELIRRHNLGIKPGQSQELLLLYAGCSLCLVTLERFLRIIPALKAQDTETLPNLLQRATRAGAPLIDLIDPATGHPGDRATLIKKVVAMRNAIQHGNYEQAAKLAGFDDVRSYFGASGFARDIEWLYQFTDGIVAQIDPATGETRPAGG